MFRFRGWRTLTHAHNHLGRGDALSTLDVHFISSLPVTPGTVYKVWVESKPVQMVWGVD
jgi:hypothetical protein